MFENIIYILYNCQQDHNISNCMIKIFTINIWPKATSILVHYIVVIYKIYAVSVYSIAAAYKHAFQYSQYFDFHTALIFILLSYYMFGNGSKNWDG